jgi:hypothetical protein
MQYPLQKQQADTRTLELERAYRESAERAFARQIACKKKKTVALIVSVIGLLLSVVAFMAQPIAGAAVLALSVGTVSLLILLWRREVAKCREEQGMLGGIEQQRDEQKKKTAQLQSDLHSACDRIREVLGVQVSDAEAAQGAVEEYEAHRAQVTAQRREREAVRQAWYDRIYALRQSADEEKAFLHQLWAWGDCPDVDDAPVKVERLAQRAARYAQLQEQLAATLKQREALRARLKELQEKKDTLLQGCIDVPTVGVATWLRERREQAQRLQMSCERQRRELSEFAEQNGFSADEIDVTEQLPLWRMARCCKSCAKRWMRRNKSCTDRSPVAVGRSRCRPRRVRPWSPWSMRRVSCEVRSSERERH